MTEQFEYTGDLQQLQGRLRALDGDIPVPQSVKAPQLLARMREQAERPALRVVRPRWHKAAGVAAAFLLIVGGVWLTGYLRGAGGVLQGMPQLDAAPEAAMSTAAAAEAPAVTMTGEYARDYDEVRARLLAAQTELLRGEADDMDGAAPQAFAAPTPQMAAEAAPEDTPETAADAAAPSAAPAAAAEAGTETAPAEEAPAGATANTAGADVAMGAQPKQTENGAGGEPAPMMARNAEPYPGTGSGMKSVEGSDGKNMYALEYAEVSGEPFVRITSVEKNQEVVIDLPAAAVFEDVFFDAGTLGVLYRSVWSEDGASAATVLDLYDATNLEAVKSVRTFEQQGSLVYAGLDNGAVYLVTDFLVQADAADSAVPDSALVPKVRDTAGGEQVLPASDVYLPEHAASGRFAVISAVGLTEAKRASTKAVLGGADAACQTEFRLYVAGPFAGRGNTGVMSFTAKGDWPELAAQGCVEGARPGDVRAFGATENGVYVVAQRDGADTANVYTLGTNLVENAQTDVALSGTVLGVWLDEGTLYVTDSSGAEQSVECPQLIPVSAQKK